MLSMLKYAYCILVLCEPHLVSNIKYSITRHEYQTCVYNSLAGSSHKIVIDNKNRIKAIISY